jgi:hypothetical protein
VAKASKPRIGRPRKQIDPKKVERLARYGSPATEIAAVMGCSPDTLERRFAEPIKRGKDKLCYLLRKTLLSRAMEGDVACLIFATKCIAGWREPRDDAVNVQVNTHVAQNLFAVTDQAKKHFADIDQLLRRETTLLSGNGNGQHND